MPRSFRAVYLGKLFGSVWLDLSGSRRPWRRAAQPAPSAERCSIPAGQWSSSAEIRIVNQDTGTLTRTTTTDSNGSFTATLLPVGNYTVNVVSPGFQEGKFINVAVRVTETTRMEAKLRPLAVQEKVEVQAQVQTVDTSTATTGQAIDARTIRDLPLATQNFQQLLTLSAGTNSDLNASASLGRGDVRIQVNGQREDNNNYLIEGISATDYNVAELTNTPLPSPDVVQEFKVQTSLYDATQGRNGGGNINAILKTGTKTFHGSLFEFFRNTDLNANEWFLNRSQIALGLPQQSPDIKQNIFGGSMGGPIGKDGKGGFFFVNYQGTRQRSGLSPGAIVSTTLPVLPSVNRGSAGYAQSLVDTFFPGNANVTAASIDPVALNLLNFRNSQFNDQSGFLFPKPMPRPAASSCSARPASIRTTSSRPTTTAISEAGRTIFRDASSFQTLNRSCPSAPEV